MIFFIVWFQFMLVGGADLYDVAASKMQRSSVLRATYNVIGTSSTVHFGETLTTTSRTECGMTFIVVHHLYRLLYPIFCFRCELPGTSEPLVSFLVRSI